MLDISGGLLALFFAFSAIAVPVCGGQTTTDQDQPAAQRAPLKSHDAVFYGVVTVSQPKSYPAAEAEAEANTPPTGYASMFVLEPSGSMHTLQAMQGPYSECLYRFYVDGRFLWGMRKGKEYSWAPLSPGEHSFSRASNTLTFDAEPGKTYYVLIPGRGKMALLPPDEGERIRKTLSINPDRWLLRQYDANWSKVHQGMKREEVDRLLGVSAGQIRITESMHGGRGEETFTSKPIGYSITYLNDMVESKADAPVDYFAGCPTAPWR